FFLASLCDLKVPPEDRKRLGLRYPKTPEVQRLLKKLHRCKIAEKEIISTDTNAIVSALKEVLSEFPGGIFSVSNEDFICVSLHCSLEIALVYVNGLIEGLPIFLRQFTYLVCKSLRNLAQQSAGSLTDSYTDLLLLFTPVLFPNSVGDVTKFLRATRISLIMIDLCDTVFQPLIIAQGSLTDSAYHSDEDFFNDLFKNLDRLQDSFCETDSETEDDGYADSFDSEPLEKKSAADESANTQYYQITYVD
ncbi:hypothetical protein AAVH_38025, partial [Aphelenchoides avenae]